MRQVPMLLRHAHHLVRRVTSRLTGVLLEISIAALLIGPPLGITAASAAPDNVLSMEAGSGKVVTLAGAASNVFVADPKVAEVRPASDSTLFVFGVGPGHTTIAALDGTGHLVAQYEVTVIPSHFGANEAQAAIARMIPGSRIAVQPANKGLLITGRVENAGEAAQAAAIARGYIGDNQVVENQLSIQSSIQVTLQVRVAEMSRQVVRALGVDWQALGSIGKYAALGFATPGGAVAGAFGSIAGSYVDHTTSVTGVIDALSQDNLAHILAEPSLTVMSGQSASFLVGGEFPVPVSEQNGVVAVSFKNFGVSLAFVPTVFSDGRISVHVAPEVSSISNTNSVTVAVGSASSSGSSSSSSGNSTTTSSFTIPSLVVQRAETTVELGSGQTFAIAGLLQDVVQHNTTGLPFLGDIPVLGPLFRSDAFNRQQTELVILVTPFIVKPVNDRLALHTPDESYTPPGELDRLLLLHQMGSGGPATPVRIPGDAGFVVQ
jgi:pilus assembly protein CpaC